VNIDLPNHVSRMASKLREQEGEEGKTEDTEEEILRTSKAMHTTKRGGQCNSSHLLIVNKLRSACVNKWVGWAAVLRESVSAPLDAYHLDSPALPAYPLRRHSTKEA